MRQTDVFAASQLEVRQAAIDDIPIQNSNKLSILSWLTPHSAVQSNTNRQKG